MKKGFLMAFLGASAYGIQPIFTKLLLNLGINSTTLIFHRFVCVALISGAYLAVTQKFIIPSTRQIRDLLIFGILGCAGTIFLLTNSYHYLPVGQATMIYFSYPVFVALIMVFFFKEKISIYKIMALSLAILGLFFLGDFKIDFNLMGTILALGSGLAFAIYMISVDKSSYQTMEAEVLIFYLALVNILFFGIQGALSSSLQWLPQQGFLYIIGTVLATMVGLLMITRAIRIIGSVNTAIICVFEPVISLMGGIIIFKEICNFRIVFGSMLMVLSVFLVTGLEKKKSWENNFGSK